MGFDFGDAEPEKEVPAAGFRIKTMKPAPKADAGESEQENDTQESGEESTTNKPEDIPSRAPELIQTAIPDAPDDDMPYIGTMNLASPVSESNPNNDSEVIHNIPADTAPDKTADTAYENRQENHIAENPVQSISAGSNQTEQSETDELEAVEEVIEEEEEKQEPVETPPIAPQAMEETIPQAGTPAAPVNRGPLLPPKQIYAEPEKSSQEKATQSATQKPVQQAAAPATQPVEVSKPAQPATTEKTTSNTNQFTAGVVPDSQENPVTQRNTTPAPAAAKPAAPVAKQQQPVAETEEEYIIQEESHSLPEEETEISEEAAQTKKSTRGRKSLKALDAEASHVHIPDDSTLFRRQYYSIGEVAGMFGVNQSLLRFWENEFDIIQPRKNRKGDRHFRPVDIKNLELIYDLLRRRKLTIEGAKDFLKKNRQARERFEMIQSLQQIKGFLLEIKASL